MFIFKYYRADEPNINGVIQLREGELYFQVLESIMDILPQHELPLLVEISDFWGVPQVVHHIDIGGFCSNWDCYDKVFSVKTATGKTIFNWTFNGILDGDICYQMFLNWVKLNKGAWGIAIGANDGMCGEWVRSVLDGELFGVLVEPTKESCDKLRLRYRGISNVVIEETLVTDHGGPEIFWEGVHSACNSINKDHSLGYSTDVIGVEMSSVTVSDLLGKWNISGDWWLHIDCEGYDDKIIYSLDMANLPKIIVYEHVNFLVEEKDNLVGWLNERGYKVYSSFMNAIAIR